MSEPLVELEGARIEANGQVLAASLTLSLEGPRVVVVGDGTALFEPLFHRARVTDGTFRIAGISLADAGTELGLAPLDPPLPLDWSPLEYVTWSARLAGVSKREAESLASDACARAGLGDAATTALAQLGVVPRRLTVLAHAAVVKTRLVVVETPLVGLDPSAAGFVLAALGRLVGDSAVVVSTARFEPNSPAESLARGASEVVVIAGGKVLEAGAPSAIRTLWAIEEPAESAESIATPSPDDRHSDDADLG